MPNKQRRPLRSGDSVIAMLDVLGARCTDLGAAQKLMGKIESICQANTRQRADFAERHGPAWSFEITVVGDTIIIVWDGRHRNWLETLGTVCGGFIVQGLSEGIAFRGAIGIGELVVADGRPIILGPGITDAAEWYDELDAIGVIASPKLGMLIEKDAPDERLSTEGSFFTKAQVPLRGGRTEDMWMVAWPDMAAIWTKTADARCRHQLLSWLQHFQMPRGTHQKYLNTLKFFDWYHGRYSAHMEKLAAIANGARPAGAQAQDDAVN